ncbi:MULTISPECIES: ChuX/HutX family heme-like substrate-binding protein [unclassified Dyella]|uniref:hemin-degrading factor n=1 Tax=unclassified Dyella TaxID=2634549 RepID=UPI000C82A367|nr:MULTISPECIES: ChuX/HutX family heme-like substrate-binding protein [unclassified Dyella]MDR3447180.1 ChuX/HutX family heme-like substrate-binding protein [Dyella sp.]PMQ04668.1 Hemin transport protein HemS [Dyella sp. AD56]
MLDNTSSPASALSIPELLDASRRLREREPGLRARDLADRLGVSEAELVASRCGDGVTRLEGPWAPLIEALPMLGHVMVLTRNDSCVHEKKGRFDHIEIGGVMGVVLDEAIDLRIFLKHWVFGFAVRENSRGRLLQSLQFFDADGRAVHKVYLTEHSHHDVWSGLVGRFAAAVQSPLLAIHPVDDPLPWKVEDDEVDVVGLRERWRRLRDPHDFFAMLKKHQVTRTQALRLAGREFARQVNSDAIRTLLESAAATGLPIMVFVGSPGVVQIHTGPVTNIKVMGLWINVLDDDFNLHLREDHITESWVVRKPTPEGHVTSLELYDARGGQIVQLFGKRKPGIPELEAWRALAESLADREAGHA